MVASRIIPLLFIVTVSAAAQDAQFRGNARRTGIYDSRPSILSSVAWKYDTGGPVYSSPAVIADTVFIGSAERGLHAVAKNTGQRKCPLPPTNSRRRFLTRHTINENPRPV